MTEQEINAAIAGANGWKDVWLPCDSASFVGTSPDNKFAVVPDYCNDLNAMHEVEKTMLFSQRKKFVFRLQKVIGRQFAPEAMVWLDACIHATARQRAEAFLRVIGKWKEAAK